MKSWGPLSSLGVQSVRLGAHAPNRCLLRVPSARTGPTCPRTIEVSLPTTAHALTYGRAQGLRRGHPRRGWLNIADVFSRIMTGTSGLGGPREHHQRAERGRLAPEPLRYNSLSSTCAIAAVCETEVGAAVRRFTHVGGGRDRARAARAHARLWCGHGCGSLPRTRGLSLARLGRRAERCKRT